MEVLYLVLVLLVVTRIFCGTRRAGRASRTGWRAGRRGGIRGGFVLEAATNAGNCRKSVFSHRADGIGHHRLDAHSPALDGSEMSAGSIDKLLDMDGSFAHEAKRKGPAMGALVCLVPRRGVDSSLRFTRNICSVSDQAPRFEMRPIVKSGVCR